MKHFGTKVIETDRLLLRPFKLEDTELAFENWHSDPEVTKYLTWPAKEKVSESEEFIKERIDSYQDLKTYDWVIHLKDIDEPIGSIGVVDLNENINEVEIGYCIGKNWWNQGILTEALKALINFFFEEVKVNRLVAKHDVENPASGRVMEKSGLIYEGTLREAVKNNRGIVDIKEYSILASDYFSDKNDIN